MKSVKSHFTKSYHTRWKIKNNVSDKLLFNLYELSEVTNRNCHVTACWSAVYKRCFCWLLGFFFVWEECPMRSNATTNTRYWWQIFWNIACACETWNLNTKKRNKRDRENVLQKTVQGRNFSELTEETEKLKIKRVRTRQSAELINSERSGTITRDGSCAEFHLVATRPFIPA